MSRSLYSLVLVIGIAFFGSTQSLTAAPGPSVRVRFEVRSAYLKRVLGTAADRIIPDVRRRLASELGMRLRHWTFNQGDGNDATPSLDMVFRISESQDPGERVELDGDEVGSLSVGVSLQIQDVNLTLSEKWLDISGLLAGGSLERTTAADEIVMAVSDRILEKHRVDLRAWLSEYVPIAFGAHWQEQDTQPRLVLALPWDVHEALRVSVFRVMCDWPSRGGSANVVSSGPGYALPYSPPPPEPAPDPPFNGIVVIANDIKYGGGHIPPGQLRREELLDLHPGAVMLQEYKPTIDWH